MPLTWQALHRLMRELGPARPKELAMACERFTSAQALQWGFLNHVEPDAEVFGEAGRLAERQLSLDPLTLATTNPSRTALETRPAPQQFAKDSCRHKECQ